MNSMLPTNPMNLQQTKSTNNLNAYKYSPEYVDQVKEYNGKVVELDPQYTSVRPLQQLIVRAFLIEPKVSESGLVTPFKEVLDIPTHSGVGKAREYETDWPYNQKGVIVAVPTGMTSLKVGDIIQLNPRAIQIGMKGKGNNATPVVVNGFIHVDSGLFEPPKDVTNQHYGYVLIQPNDVQAILATLEVPHTIKGDGNVQISSIKDSTVNVG